MAKTIWVRADRPISKDARRDIVREALESGVTTAIVRPEDADFKNLGSITLIFNDKGRYSDGSIYIELKTPADQERALALAGKCGNVILGTSDWTIIPLENMIAKFRTTRTKITACVTDPEQAKTYLNVLEKGVNNILIDSGADIGKFVDVLGSTESVKLSEVTVKSVRKIEMGDRVCVDTVSMMIPGEGMLVGSTSSCLFLVQSESEESGYVAARPFRVNAGAVYAYVLVPGGKTRYLSELKSGEPVLITDAKGRTRASSVGRCKVEKRPLLIVEASDGKNLYSTILQNAETVKLIGPEGAISVSKLREGNKVYARLEDGGRHFGMKIDESIREI